MLTCTRKQLDRFINRRNTSDFRSNLQFQIDAEREGLNLSELLNPRVVEVDGSRVYEWDTPFGVLREIHNGPMSLA